MNPKDSENAIMSSITGFLSGNLISRFTGFFREIIMVAFLGVNSSVASFWIAFRILFFLRRIFGESLLNMTFIPYFENLRKKSPERTGQFLHNITKVFFHGSLTIVLILESALFIFYKFCSPQQEFVILLTMLLLPGGIFLVLYALNFSVLLCHQKFFLPSVAPATVNVFWILLIVGTYKCTCESVLVILSSCLVLGFVCQWLTTLPSMRGIKILYPICSNERCCDLWNLLFPILLSIGGIAANYFNGLGDMFLARKIDPSGPAFLWYAIRVQQLPLSLLTLGVFSAVLSPISRAVQAEEKEKIYHLMSFALKITTIFMLIITFGIFLLGLNGLEIIYGHGRFSYGEVLTTSKILFGYAPGLLPVSLVSVVNVLFYAKGKYTVPLIIGCCSVIFNITLSYIFGVVIYKTILGIAVVTTITAWLQLCCLWFFSEFRNPVYRGLVKNILPGVGKVILVLNSSYWLTFSLFFYFKSYCNAFTFISKLGLFSVKASIFLVFLFLFAKLLRSDDLLEFFRKDFWKNRGSLVKSEVDLRF